MREEILEINIDQLYKVTKSNKAKQVGACLRSFQSTWPAPEEDAWDCGQ